MEFLTNDTVLATVFIQVIGAIGYITYVASSFQTSRMKLLALEIVGCGFIALQWYMMGFATVALMNLVYVYLGVVSLGLERFPKARGLLVMSFPLIAILTMASWQGATLGLLAICATLLSVLATGLAVCSKFCIDIYRLRVFSLLSTVIWIMCGLIGGSIPQIIACSAFAYGHIRALLPLHAARKGVMAQAVAEDVLAADQGQSATV